MRDGTEGMQDNVSGQDKTHTLQSVPVRNVYLGVIMLVYLRIHQDIVQHLWTLDIQVIPRSVCLHSCHTPESGNAQSDTVPTKL